MLRYLALVAAFSAALFAGVATAAAQTAPNQQLDPENTLILTLKDGRVVIRLRPDLAPKHVEQVKTLVRRGFYDGLTFHRVITGFMAQTGDPRGDGTGGSNLPNIPAEFTPQPFQRGTVGMARSSAPDSANSQFFICFDDAPHLTRNYTAFGQVVSGMEFVDKIKKGDPGSGRVSGPDKIVSLKVMADVKQ